MSMIPFSTGISDLLFEAFFNWVETGELRTDSTDKLNTVMWIWPENLKGWLIGTGLFANFVYSTDIGYCRFILYCGLIGFGTFIAFFVYNAWVFACKFPFFRLLSFFLLALSFIIWMKVATDLFFIYALFIAWIGKGNRSYLGRKVNENRLLHSRDL